MRALYELARPQEIAGHVQAMAQNSGIGVLVNAFETLVQTFITKVEPA